MLKYHWPMTGDQMAWTNTTMCLISNRISATPVLICSNCPQSMAVPSPSGGVGLQFFGNTNSLLSNGNVDLLGSNIISTTFWYRPDVVDTVDTRPLEVVKVGQADYNNSTNSIDISWYSGANSTFTLRGPTTGATDYRQQTFTTGSTIWKAGRWIHVTIIWDTSTSAGNIQVFMNASPIALTVNGGLTKTASAVFPNYTWWIMNKVGSSLFTKGRISDYRIYCGQLSTNQVLELYNSYAKQIGP